MLITPLSLRDISPFRGDENVEQPFSLILAPLKGELARRSLD